MKRYTRGIGFTPFYAHPNPTLLKLEQFNWIVV